MFEKFDPRKGKQFQILTPEGEILQHPSSVPLMDKEEIMTGFKTMVLAREADLWAVSLNRQGRMPTYPPIQGQEANSIGAALALNRDDWIIQAFREMGALLIRGIPLSQQYLLWLGNEIGNKLPVKKYHVLPVSVPIASQLPHAVGIAYGEMLRGNKNIAIGYVGDGGTSEGDFHEACNFAGVWKAPVVIYVQNNQWAISVPRSRQTASATIAEKAFGYGFEGIQIDGNDIFAVYAAVRMAAEKARKGEGPTLIEGFTYRLGAHTTADDPTRYRENREVEEWKKKDPLIRLEKYIINQKLMNKKEIENLKTESKEFVRKEFEKAEQYPAPSVEDTFLYTYETLPPLLEKQMDEIKKRFAQKERG